MSQNGIASAEDFRKLAEAEAFEEPQRIILPKSGLAVMVRRPRPLAYALVGTPLPQGLAAKLKTRDSGLGTRDSQTGSSNPESRFTSPDLSPEERAAIARRYATVFVSCFVQPKFSLDPGPDEVSPNWLPQEDATFLVRYLGGEVVESGTGNPSADGERGTEFGDLATFPGERPRPAAAGAGGGGVGNEAVSAVEGTDIRLPD